MGESRNGSTPDDGMRARPVRPLDRSAADDSLRGILQRPEHLAARPAKLGKPERDRDANLKNTVVALPVGYTANPSLAAGLGVCTPARFQSETSSSAPGAGCPEESKIGTVEVETPVLAEKIFPGTSTSPSPSKTRLAPSWDCTSSLRTQPVGSSSNSRGTSNPTPSPGSSSRRSITTPRSRSASSH